MAGKFTGQVTAWVAETKQRMTSVRNMAVERVVEVAQTPVAAGGNMPVDTGFLRASLRVIRNGALPMQTDNPGLGSFNFDAAELTAVLAGAGLTDVITVVWTANYARPANYGARGRQGRKFRDLAAQQWPRLVAESAAQLQGQVQGRQGASIYQGGAI